jgi:acyl-CoA reductase-like NAD-dependent aldehyde dehydrogenase
MTASDARSGAHLAHYCHASRKDFRDATVAARAAQPGWRASGTYLRGQILYRAAEMLESRSESLVAALRAGGASVIEARTEVAAAADRLVHFAGWTDKYEQIFSSVNPVSGPFLNFTRCEPTGVVAIIAPDQSALLSLVSLIAQVILSGNTAIVLASETTPLPALDLAEVWATSDLPGGAVNILTGLRAELAPWIAGHMDVNAIVDGSSDRAIAKVLAEGAAENLKRVFDHGLATSDWFGEAATDPSRILDTTESKTTWHTLGI